MIEQDKEIHLEGIPLSEGIGTGIFFLSKGKEASIPEFAISSCRVSYEIARYRRAISSSRDELQHLYKRLEDEGSYEVCGIIDTHIQMLSDPIIADSVEEKIAHMRQNTESVFMYVIDDYKRMFRRHIKGDVADERLLDLKDLSSRILSHLNTQPTKNALCGQPNSIYADHEIVPTKAAEAKKGFIKGFISKIGGEKSHSAIIARAKGIPFVSGIDLSLLEDLEKKPAIIDGFTGKVIISPSKETLEKYLKKSRGAKKMFTAAITSGLGLKTRDGKSVHVSANFDCMDDLEKLLQNNISHVGLIRTEFLFLQDAVTTLSMQFQVEKYEEIIKGAGGALLTFRLFDIGSDKKIIEMDELEPNPALGCRSIRFLMKYPEIFLLQVKALYVASLKGNIRLLLPLVTDYDELLTALSFIENARREISKEMNRDIPKLKIGCMVEVPSLPPFLFPFPLSDHGRALLHSRRAERTLAGARLQGMFIPYPSLPPSLPPFPFPRSPSSFPFPTPCRAHRVHQRDPEVCPLCPLIPRPPSTPSRPLPPSFPPSPFPSFPPSLRSSLPSPAPTTRACTRARDWATRPSRAPRKEEEQGWRQVGREGCNKGGR